jgi:hypothetical protein
MAEVRISGEARERDCACGRAVLCDRRWAVNKYRRDFLLLFQHDTSAVS